MDKGFLYVAFGTEYDKVAAYSVKHLRTVSSLPVCVVTNLVKQNRSSIWSGIKDVVFRYLKLNDLESRVAKCKPDIISPFEKTIYVDCDTVVLSKKFVEVFDFLDFCDIALPAHTIQESIDRLKMPIYKQAIKDFRPKKVDYVYQAGVLAFRKNKRVRSFFELWYSYWRKRKLRDMPCLVCAIGNFPDISIMHLSKDYSFIDSSIIQHYSGCHRSRRKNTKDVLPDYTKTLVWEKGAKFRWQKFPAFRQRRKK